MPCTQWLKYRQLRHALQSRISPEEETQENSPLELRLLGTPMIRKSISLVYGTLMRYIQGDLTKLKAKWEKDVGELDEDDWRDALGYSATAVIKASYRLPD